MDSMVVGSIVLLVMMGVFYWIYRKGKKRIRALQQDLNFFKKEKEYHSEAMLVLDKQNNIMFANGTAQKLFDLKDANRTLPNTKKVKLNIDGKEPREFFEVLKEQSDKHPGNFHLQNVLLTVGSKTQQANIYIEKKNINEELTCIIDMQKSTPKEVETTKDGKIDFLTGLPSQYLALQDINRLTIESKKNSRSFALLLMGVDHFSELQTTLGPAYTNQVLKKIATYIVDNKEDHIQIYHMDCDKFLLIVDNIEDIDTVKKIAKKVIANIANINKTDENVRVTTSIGIVKYPEHGENTTKLISHVYSTLAEAQSVSDSNIEIFTPGHQKMNKDDVKINEEIRQGLKNHEFFLYYQPIFNLKTEEMTGVEALLRWKHPELGVIEADRFLKVAEKTGLIVDVGEYVFREAIKQRKVWNDIGINKFKISLNLSPKEMQVEKLIQKLKILFEDNKVDPQDFNLDITEKAAMSNIEKTMIDFKLLRELGLSISLDNFGVGSLSIRHLQLLPLSMIKIDRSLIFDLYSNLDHQITVKAMINMIHDLGFEAAAEGVETSKESALLYDLGCDHVQGYLFSKPLPAAEFQDLLK